MATVEEVKINGLPPEDYDVGMEENQERSLPKFGKSE